jgi:hypothetical protein
MGEVAEGQPYYKLALEKAGAKPALLTTVFREMGYSLFMKSNAQDLPAARNAYLAALKNASDKSWEPDPRIFAEYLFEFANWELSQGDWKCGQTLRAAAASSFAVLAQDQQAQYSLAFFENLAASKVKNSQQTDTGCNFTVPAN